jgi:hypothetical protein
VAELIHPNSSVDELSTRETAPYRLRIIGEEAGLFQSDESLPNKVPIAVDEEHDFHDRPGSVPDVRDLQQIWVCFQRYA